MTSGASDFKLPNLQQVLHDAQASSIDLLRDVELNVKIELGRARMLVEDVLKLANRVRCYDAIVGFFSKHLDGQT